MHEAARTSPAISATRRQWIVRLREAAQGKPTFMFFPHAGGSPLSAGRLAAALPDSVGVMALQLPRQASGTEAGPPRRVADAVEGIVRALDALALDTSASPLQPLIFVGNSYGALLAFETAARLSTAALRPARLIVSGFRSPCLPPAETPLYRLPVKQLRAELVARFGMAGGDGVDWGCLGLEQALRADLEACDTYRYRHTTPLSLPIDVMHLRSDPSVSPEELLAWRTVTCAPARLVTCDGGHFFWASHSTDFARILLDAAALSSPISHEKVSVHAER
ncbi:thioesterase II family protein [Pollutimonas thiosulfatoxidans]|uniref:Thioesterase domain-containing protein n=1 Tax=Pollutimonas thiosulfatoxidans TaxID=2028345 RepID=A0A410GG83_9BURK|nr:alpha/beta fold hydrolase [Pollutimonas thiosulfatoxidans]NYT45501.1 thioesterase [Alcaligenaceae bacterium]QAA95288.1 hypothetical protein CKA81_16530 [Pollutimonas thiosulfatoxidans]